ncbi:hypothetical protein FQA39_LY12724 [Lamprigera yunnana]|nr:hypothetical protein FQA39_LY12724 [Lamprigera yunnana]
MGYAIGIGNVWRFPYLCYRNGGGAFLVPYLIMLFLCGIPLFFLETSLGQFSGQGCITMFEICPLFKGAGFAIIVVNLICTMYYNVIIAYPILFLTNCFQAKLPWSDCDNEWNSPACLQFKCVNLAGHAYSLVYFSYLTMWVYFHTTVFATISPVKINFRKENIPLGEVCVFRL